MEPEEPVKQGLLLLPPQGVLGQLKKTWHKRYCQLFKASKSGVDRLEIWDSREDSRSQQCSPRIITLEACVKIGPTNQPKVFTVITKSTAHHFGCHAENETHEWINAFQQVAFKATESLSSRNNDTTIEEDNDLYCTSGEGIFSVKLIETEASKRCGLEPKSYTLAAGSADIRLIDGNTTLYIWPYRFIRKYGYKSARFTFEAGRKCVSGEGCFELEHGPEPEIYRCIYAKMRSMKKFLQGERDALSETSTLSGFDINDLPYHAALSMEVGSRAAVALTPKLSALFDLDVCTSAQNSAKSTSYFSESAGMTSSPYIKPPPPLTKPKPVKPPRKYVFPGFTDKKLVDSESPSVVTGAKKHHNTHVTPESRQRHVKPDAAHDNSDFAENRRIEKHPYDIVEVRNQAWRTYGIDTVPHTERLKDQRILPPEKYVDRLDVEKNDDRVEEEHHFEKNIDDGSDNDTVEDEGSRFAADNEDIWTDDDVHYEKLPVENNTPIENNTISPIIHNNLLTKSNSIANYDKLQHIGSTYKLNNNPGYRVPNVSPSIAATNSQTDDASPRPTWSDYDVVEDISSIRLVDDSSRGYGVIKKKTSLPGPKHTVINNSEYAIVSKPKRV